MTQEEAKKFLPLIQAYAEGKTIQVKLKTDGKALTENWADVVNTDWNVTRCYRIKPEPKYRPFKDTEECWEEMQKHQPFGWTKLKGEIEYSFMTDVNDNINYSDAIREYTFADGTPFGIKEDRTKTE